MCFSGRKCYRFLFLPQQVHRTLMTTTVLFTIAGIIVIFVHKKGWSSVSRVINCKSNCNIDVINPYRQTSLVKAGVQKNISLFVLSSILKITHVIVLKGKIGLHCNHERIRYVNHLFLAPQQAHKANTISNQVRLDMSAISFIYLSIFLKIYFMLDFFFSFFCVLTDRWRTSIPWYHCPRFRNCAANHGSIQTTSWRAQVPVFIFNYYINNLNSRKFILKSCKLFFVFSLRRYYLTSQKQYTHDTFSSKIFARLLVDGLNCCFSGKRAYVWLCRLGSFIFFLVK